MNLARGHRPEPNPAPGTVGLRAARALDVRPTRPGRLWINWPVIVGIAACAAVWNAAARACGLW